MPHHIQLLDQRVLILKALLEMMRMHCHGYFSGRRFGTSVADFLLLASIFIGQAEGRPMNPSKLANFAGLPRPTVIRKLRQFETGGLLINHHDGSHSVMAALMNSDDSLNAVEGARRLFERTAEQLSKMDTPGLAKHF